MITADEARKRSAKYLTAFRQDWLKKVYKAIEGKTEEGKNSTLIYAPKDIRDDVQEDLIKRGFTVRLTTEDYLSVHW